MGHPSRPPRDPAVRAVVEPAVTSLGLDLEDLDVQAAGRRRRVCVVVDRDGGIDLDGIAEVSRAVSEALDSSDAMGDDPYTLEVTSPGVDRPLTLPRHWRRNVGRRVKLHAADGSILEGRIRAADDDAVTVAVDTGPRAESTDRTLEWSQVQRGDVQIEFKRADAPRPDAEEA
jgi:ribosome maturation factor RimP